MKEANSSLILGKDNLTITQINNILNYTDIIIDNLDAAAILELSGGYEKDTDKLLGQLIIETDRVLHGDNKSIQFSSFDYLTKLSESINESLRKESFGYFLVNVLTDFEVYPHHLEWVSHVESYRNLVLIASRGIGKSKFASWAYPLWKMYRYEKPIPFQKQRESIKLCDYGIMFTNEMDLARTLMGYVIDAIETNSILTNRLFPDKADNWNKESIKTKNGAFLEIKSAGSKSRGRHPGYKILDDYLQDNIIYNQDQNTKVIEQYNSVIFPMGKSRKASTLIVGTPMLFTDLYGVLKKKDKYKVFEYPAIFPDGSLLCPERKSMKDIMEDKSTMTNLSFSREILCKPITNDSTIFPYEILVKCFSDKYTIVNNIHSHPVKFKKVVVGCDFAKSANIGADYTVYVVLGIDDAGYHYILDIQRSHGKSFGQQIADLKLINANFKPQVMFYEDNGFQAIYAEESIKAGLPVKASTTTENKYDLKDGLPSLALLFEHRKIIIPRGDEKSVNLTDLLMAELSSITFTEKGLKSVSGHDDQAFALWKSIQASRYKTSLEWGFME